MSNLYAVDQYFEVIEDYKLNVQFKPYGHESSGDWRVYQGLGHADALNEGSGDTLVQAIDSFLSAIQND